MLVTVVFEAPFVITSVGVHIPVLKDIPVGPPVEEDDDTTPNIMAEVSEKLVPTVIAPETRP
jgi:hypothetical protein